MMSQSEDYNNITAYSQKLLVTLNSGQMVGTLYIPHTRICMLLVHTCTHIPCTLVHLQRVKTRLWNQPCGDCHVKKMQKDRLPVSSNQSAKHTMCTWMYVTTHSLHANDNPITIHCMLSFLSSNSLIFPPVCFLKIMRSNMLVVTHMLPKTNVVPFL